MIGIVDVPVGSEIVIVVPRTTTLDTTTTRTVVLYYLALASLMYSTIRAHGRLEDTKKVMSQHIPD